MTRSITKFLQSEIGKIHEDWEVKTINEIKSRAKSSLAMGPFGAVPIVRRNNLTPNSFLDNDFVYLTEEKFDIALKQILSKAVISDRVIDIFEAAGIQKPELSILSEGFLAEVKEMPQKNLAFEALKKLLNDEIRILSRRNIVQGKSFMDMDKTIKKYTNRSVEAAQVIGAVRTGKKSQRREEQGQATKHDRRRNSIL
jgi:type I site-specific restriction-modification system R (restriction) subunit